MPPKKYASSNGDVKKREWTRGGTSTRIIAGNTYSDDTRPFRSKVTSKQILFSEIKSAKTPQQGLVAIKNFLVQSNKGSRNKASPETIRKNLQPWIGPLFKYIANIESFEEWERIIEYVLDIPSEMDIEPSFRTAVGKVLSSKSTIFPKLPKDFFKVIFAQMHRHPHDMEFLKSLGSKGFHHYIRTSSSLQSLQQLKKILEDEKISFFKKEQRGDLQSGVRSKRDQLSRPSVNDPIITTTIPRVRSTASRQPLPSWNPLTYTPILRPPYL